MTMNNQPERTPLAAQRALDEKVDINRNQLKTELNRVIKFALRGGCIALFTVPSQEVHKIAIVSGLPPAPEDTTLVVHNYPIDTESVPLLGASAWLFRPHARAPSIQFSTCALTRDRNGDWQNSPWIPKIEVHGKTHLSLSMERDRFSAQDGVPIMDTAEYPNTPELPKHFNTPRQAEILAAGVCALKLCTEQSLNREVTQYPY